MNGLLKLTLSLSLSGAVLIVLLAALKPLVKGRVSKRWQYYIWLLVIARLFLPLGPPESPAGNAVADIDAAAVSVLALPAGENTYTDAAEPPQENHTDPEPSNLQKLGAAVWENLWLIWLAGALGLLTRKITAYQGFTRFIRAGWAAVDDPALLDQVAVIGGEIGVKRPVELYVNPLAASPMLLGWRRPCIVLPAAGLPEEDFRFVVLHELTHYRRRDGLYKWLVQLAVCVHWFNPLVYWMNREIQRAGELSCDEAVLRRLDGTERRAYGNALLRTVAAGGAYKAAVPSATLGESGEQLKERLDMIMKFKKPTKFAAVLAALLAVALGVTATAAGAYTGIPAGLGGNGAVYGVSNPNKNGLRMVGKWFTREGLYEPPYMFDIGWNGTMEGAATQITLPDGSSMTVCLAPAAKGLAQDAEARQALSKALNRLWEQTKDNPFPLASPIVFRYEDTGGSETAELAEESYDAWNLPFFQTAFAALPKAQQEAWLEKFYGNSDFAFFSASLDGLKDQSIQGEFAEKFSEKAYQDGDFAFFSCSTDRLAKDKLETWLARAKKDGQAGFQSILMNKLGKDDEREELEAFLDAQQAAQYKAVGVTVDGKDYYYKAKVVPLFLDHRADSSVYTLNMNPKGSVNIKILRDADNQITGVAYMTQAEVTELFGDMSGGGDGWDDNDWQETAGGEIWRPQVIPIDLKTIEAGETIFLGEYTLSDGDKIWYDISAETGNRMQVFFAKDQQENVVYWSVNNLRQPGEPLNCIADFTVGLPAAEPGTYRLYLQAPDGALGNVTGSISIGFIADAS